jgi:hypothetical protein
MPIAKITGQGLAAIACSVGLLWGCLIVEHVARRSAVRERTRVVRELRRMQQGPSQPAPVSVPVPFVRHRLHVSAG